MFGGHIPEEPALKREGFGDFGVKLDPKKMPAAFKDGTINEAAITRAAGRVTRLAPQLGNRLNVNQH